MKRIPEIDILRALATVMLLVHHSGLYQLLIFGYTLKPLIRTQVGFALLGTFIFLAGFLLGHQIRNNPGIRMGEYYWRRVARLYPPYIVSLLLFRLLLGIPVETSEFWIHLFGLQIILAPAYSTPIITLWYFGLLIFCLLIVPFGLVRFKKVGSSIIYLVSFFALCYFLHDRYQIIEIRFFYFYWIFAIGGLIGRYRPRGQLITQPLSIFVSLIVLTATGYRLYLLQTAYLFNLHWGHIATATGFMLAFLHLSYLLANGIKKHAWVEKIGGHISRGSYFTYIYHRPIWQILLFPFALSEGPVAFLFRILIGAPLVILLSGKLQVLYEGSLRGRSRVSS